VRYSKRQLDPSTLSSAEKKDLEALGEVLREHRGAYIASQGGVQIDLPGPILNLIEQAIESVGRGETLQLVAQEETMTTQEAADFLGFSRPFLIGLLEKGEIPFQTVGKHRRLATKDVRTFGDKRNRERKKALDDLFDKIDEAGFYE